MNHLKNLLSISKLSFVTPQNDNVTSVLQNIVNGMMPSTNHPMHRVVPQSCTPLMIPPISNPGLNFKHVPVSFISITQPSQCENKG